MQIGYLGVSRWRRRVIYFVICVMLPLSLLVACASNSIPPSHQNKRRAITAVTYDLVSPDYLTIGTSSDKPPMEFMDANTHQAAGFDIDLVEAIAARMNLQVKIVSANLDTLIPDLNAKHYDIVMAGMTITAERKQEASFIPYFSQGESLLVQKGNPHAIESLGDLCGQSVGVQNGTLAQIGLQIADEACKKAERPTITSIVLQDQYAVIQLLATNHVVATYQDSPVTDYYLGQEPGRFEMAGVVINTAIAGIAVRKTDMLMQASVQNAFNQVERDGTYHALLEKWRLTGGAIA